MASALFDADPARSAEERKALVPEGAAETPEVPTQEETVDASEALTSPSDTEGGSEAGSAAGKAAGKSKDLRRKAAGVSAKERQAARAKAKDAKQAAADLRRLEDEDARIERRLETIEREFRRLLGVTRVRPLGKDRFHNRVWWFDGLGSANLIGSGGTVLYGTGRLFIQGPSEFDVDLLHRREKEDQDVESRRKTEEGEDGMLGVGEWAVFEDPEEVSTHCRHEWTMDVDTCPAGPVHEVAQPEGCTRAGSPEHTE
jgi:bromodomain adjacent to zinc finger domain protein 1A